jgi:hypothetical protein
MAQWQCCQWVTTGDDQALTAGVCGEHLLDFLRVDQALFERRFALSTSSMVRPLRAKLVIPYPWRSDTSLFSRTI